MAPSSQNMEKFVNHCGIPLGNMDAGPAYAGGMGSFHRNQAAWQAKRLPGKMAYIVKNSRNSIYCTSRNARKYILTRI